MSRRYPGQRALRIAARTVHIGAAAMTLGQVACGVEPGTWPVVLLLSGAAIVADDLYRYGADWLRYVQGQAVLLKLVLVTLGVARPEWLLACLWAALVVGSLVSHAPGSLRQRALWGPPGPCAVRKRAGGCAK